MSEYKFRCPMCGDEGYNIDSSREVMSSEMWCDICEFRIWGNVPEEQLEEWWQSFKPSEEIKENFLQDFYHELQGEQE